MIKSLNIFKSVIISFEIKRIEKDESNFGAQNERPPSSHLNLSF